MASKMSKEDGIQYLQKLDEKLHYTQENISSIYGTGTFDYYHDDKKLTKKEVKKVLKIVQDFELPFSPINTCHGFQVGFVVYNVAEKSNGFLPDQNVKGPCLKFLEKQLPEGYGFDELSEVFLSENNLKVIKWHKLNERNIDHNPERMRDRSRYTY